MKNFLEKHILFPKKFGVQPYFYLIFMLPAIPFSFFIPLFQRIIFGILILVFLKVYRDGFRVTKYFPINIAIQLFIATLLAVSPWFGNYMGLQVFTGFEIGSSRVSRKLFKRYALAYYLAALALFIPFFQIYKFLPMISIMWMGVFYFFILTCLPFSKSQSKTYDLKSENKELMQQVRQLERERIAYDLHDNLGQTFSTITLKAEFAEKLLNKNDLAASKRELSEIAQVSRDSLTLVRKVVTGLKEESIAQVLQSEEKNLALAAVKLTVENQNLTENWPQPWHNATSAVLKEALTNVIHHAQASQLLVRFDERGFIISDNGVGLENSPVSHGMMSMRRRVEEVKGSFSIKSDSGTLITVKF